MANYQYPNAASILGAPAGQASTPRPGRQRRRNNNRQGGRGQQPPTRLPPPTGAPPCPRFLATQSTLEKNDPLWTPGMAGTEMTAMPNTEMFAALEGAENDPIWWNFPEEIQPDLPFGIRPSTACIGYGPRERLSIDQRTFLEINNILGKPFHSDKRALPLCQSVLFSVGNELAAAGIKLSPCPTALVGSQAQLGLVTISEELVPINNKTLSFKCPYQMPSEISFSASAFMYRVNHAVEDLRPGLKINIPWCVWHYDSQHYDDRWSDFGFQGNQL
ncbi:hypothetical protein SESBI_49807, partial [Sesbania bispinosa]